MLKLSTHKPGQQQQPFTFWILNKGLNSGKPLRSPCRNCFTATCDNPEEMQLYYWLSWGMWKSKQWEPFFCGSVITFIHIGDVRKALELHARSVNIAAYMQACNKLQLLEEREAVVRQQLQLMGNLKIAIMRQQLRP